MSNKSIYQYELSSAIQETLNGRRIKALVFLTFRFDPGFFEEEILPVFFDIPLSQQPKIRIIQFEDYLRRQCSIAVYYDMNRLTIDSNPPKLDYKKIGLNRKTGYFHPKNIFILVENKDEKFGLWDSLITVTMSANLTRAGWWENVESVHIEEIHCGDRCSYRRDLLEFINYLKKESQATQEHPELDMIRKFLIYELDDFNWNKKEGRWLPRMFCGQSSLPVFLFDFVNELNECNLEIISPYFDDTGTAKTIKDLLENLTLKEVRVFLPEYKDGSYLCSEKYFDSLKSIPGVNWAVLPKEIVKRESSEKNISERFVHAKVYRFWSYNDSREIFFIGSYNLTNAAHQSIKGGNFESGILIEPEVKSRLGWWLIIADEKAHKSFKEETVNDDNSEQTISGINLEFDWIEEKAKYFWESSANCKESSACVYFKGEKKFEIIPIVFDKWITLTSQQSSIIQEILISSSFIEIRLSDGKNGIFLVNETGMANKPSLLTNLTAEEILKFWSLLSQEQKEYFLEIKIVQQLGLKDYLVDAVTKQTVESMFDKFAGIFHAFGRLKKHIEDSLNSQIHKDAEHYLFGKKYDSLSSLINKIMEDENMDSVNKYLTLLCAKQLVKDIESNKKYANFCFDYSSRLRTIKQNLMIIDQVKKLIKLDSVEREKFFNWYEEMFMMNIPVPEGEDD